MIDIDVSKIISEIGEPKARLIESEEEKRQKMLIMAFSIAFLFIFIAGTITFYILSSRSKAYTSTLASDVNNLNVENSKLLDVEQKAFSVRKRNQNALAIIKNNSNWSYVLLELEKIAPKTITFTKFDVESNSLMRITGYSPDYETLSKFVVSMDGSSMFANTALSGASLILSETRTAVEFIVTFGFAQGINREAFNPLTIPENIPSSSQAVPVPGEENIEESIVEENIIEENIPVESTPPAQNITPVNPSPEASPAEEGEGEGEVLPVL